MYDVCVIGCGQIGSEVLDVIHKVKCHRVIGVDTNMDTVQTLRDRGYEVTTGDIPEAVTYFICVWNTDAVITILQKLKDREYCRRVFIETTIDPLLFDKVEDEIYGSDLFEKAAIFPHRFNPNDPDHHIFNQPRVIGAWCEPASRRYFDDFLGYYMNDKDRHWTTPRVAMLAKVCENAYRAWEIILAQELKQSANRYWVDFDLLRAAMNTKWNIDVREVRDGVKGKCLPKDLNLFNKTFPTNMASNLLQLLNDKFIKENEKLS